MANNQDKAASRRNPSRRSSHLDHFIKQFLDAACDPSSTIYYRLHNHQLVYAFHDLLQALETHSTTSSSPSEEPQAVE
jgi:IS30 family transposase